MPDDPNEVVVIVPDAAANSPDGSSPSDEPVVVEVFDAITDPTGSSDPTDPTATTDPEVVVVEEAPDGETEVFVIDPDAVDPSTGTDPTTDPTSQTDPGSDPSGDPPAMVDPISTTPGDS